MSVNYRPNLPGNAREFALQCLLDWQSADHFAEDIFAHRGRHVRISPSDRSFARELFYGTLRNLSAIDFLLKPFIQRPPGPEIINALRLGIYQLFIIDTAEHAAINESVELVAPHSRGFINAVLRAALGERPRLREALAAQPAAIRFSHPAGLLKRWATVWDEPTAEAIATWNNRAAEVFLRVNTILGTPEQLLAAVPHATPTAHPLVFRCDGPLPFGEISNAIYVQDPGTLAAPELLDPKPGESVLDACAAPGGKATYMAALMKNEGELLATDASDRRMEHLQMNLRNLGVTNTTVMQQNWETGPNTMEGRLFDAILADVPCSNTGVMRRRIDVRWRLKPEVFTDNGQRQRVLVENLLPHIKPGGRLVYSTCSLEPEENEHVVQAILAAHPEFKLTGEVRKLPHLDKCDGAYAARLDKVDKAAAPKTRKKSTAAAPKS